MAEEIQTEEKPEAKPVVEVNEEAERLKAELATAKAALKAAKEAEKAVRGNSDKLLTEKKEADARLKALGDYDKVVEILGAVKNVEEAKAIESGDVEKVYEGRHSKFLADIHNPLIAERDDWKAKYEALQADYADKAKSDPLSEAWIKAKGKPDKFKYAIDEGKRTFRYEDGKLIPYDSEGNVIYGTGGTEPLTPEQWANGFLLKEPDFKIPSQGTKAVGGGDGKLSITVNPWSSKYNGSDKYSLRTKIMSSAPQEAKRLKAEAGYKQR